MEDSIHPVHGPTASTTSPNPIRRIDSLAAEANSVAGIPDGTRRLSRTTIAHLAFQSIGVIYGDVGTSPLYVYAGTFVLNQTDDAGNTIPALHDDILGVCSLIIYSLTLIPLLKYCYIVLHANDNGNGGTFALYSLICRDARINLATNQGPEDRNLSSFLLNLPNRTAKRAARIKDFLEWSRFMQTLLLTVALVGTCCVICDGVLTPSISVLSAVSGIKVNHPSLPKDVVIGVSVAILVMLFAVQKFGTDKVGYSFAPCICVWFLSIALIGLYNICKYDHTIFKAFNPYYIYSFFERNKKVGWKSLGGVMLAITGSEAMFADLAHFSIASVQISCTFIAYPCLLLAYIGQAAWLTQHQDMVGTTFFSSIPKPVYWPMFVVATVAAIIASQAMISAVFSIVDQSMVLGCFPRCKIVHTSSAYQGQIYIPEMNWILMVLCVVVTVAIGDTSQIGHAYVVTVVAIMFITTLFVTLIMLMIWQKNLLITLSFLLCFGLIEGVYLSSVLYKLPDYGWIPLAFVAVFISIMHTWYYTRKEAYKFEVANKLSINWLLSLGSNLGIARVPGIGLIYTELSQGVPAIFAHLINNVPAMHSTLVFICIKHLPVARVPQHERILLRRIGPPAYRMYRCAVRYGYKDGDGDNNAQLEHLLMRSLEEFLHAEAAGSLHLELAPNPNANPNPNPTPNPTPSPDSSPNSSDEVSGNIVMVPSGGSLVTGAQDIGIWGGSPSESVIDSRAQNEIEHLRLAWQHGVVYLLGNTNLRCKPDSGIVRKFVIDVFYGFLRRNSRSSTDAFNIPHHCLLQVGMVYYI